MYKQIKIKWKKKDERRKDVSGRLSITSRSFGLITYEGEVKDDLPHGMGKMISEQGLRYKGEFRDGLPDGHGKETNRDGTVYTGHFRDGERNGFGAMVFFDGRRYEGDWKDGLMHGIGYYMQHNGTIIEGDFESSQGLHVTKMVGFGNIIFPNLNTYYGNWAVKGPGDLEKIQFRKGAQSTKPEGSLENIFLNGCGIYNFANGDKLEGEFKNSLLNGQGTYKSKDGEIFEVGMDDEGRYTFKGSVI